MNDDLKKYFEDMFKDVDTNIKLDNDQIKAITNDNDYVLVLAGAGTGKTTTMVGKVKYLVDIKKVDPSKILVISYTKKAVTELQDLLIDEFGINTNVFTFHSLAYKYIRKIFKNRKCIIADYNFKNDVFYDYINNLYKNGKMKDIFELFNPVTTGYKHFVYGGFLYKNYYKYKDYESYFNAYKKQKLEEAKQTGLKEIIQYKIDTKIYNDEYTTTIKNELVKSASEAIIANFLYRHGIDYEYEKVYDRIVEDRKVYKPDFTLNLGGVNVYLEYFGMDDERYNRIKKKKIEFHKLYNNKFIYLENLDFDEIETKLDYELKKMGFIYHDRTDEEIFNTLLDSNKFPEIFKLKDLFLDCIEKIKENPERRNYFEIVKKYINSIENENEKNQCIRQFNYIKDFYVYYSKRLYGSIDYYFDYSDLIYYSNKYISEKKFLFDIDYDYIVIDEYQDISDGEYTLAKNTANNTSKVFAVGDDWQSIYSFRGSNISYITKFDKYFQNPTILSIKNTYRNSQELVDIAGDFIKENPDQISKDLISFKHLSVPIHFVPYNDRINEIKIDPSNEYEALKKLIIKIHSNTPERRILILARNNVMIDNCFKYDSDFIADLDTKIRIANIDDLELDGMTIHKSKGLTFDEVIIIGMNKEFPNDEHNEYWLTNLFKYKLQKESIKHAEERRIFYVALTRTKNNVFIMYNRNASNRSEFVDELYEICKKNKKEKT